MKGSYGCLENQNTNQNVFPTIPFVRSLADVGTTWRSLSLGEKDVPTNPREASQALATIDTLELQSRFSSCARSQERIGSHGSARRLGVSPSRVSKERRVENSTLLPTKDASMAAGHTKTVSSATMLPDGRKVRCVSRRDVPFLYREIFRERCYLKHGVGIRPGDVVFDVGANIGLFALFASELCGSNGKVYAFEPLPSTYEALRHNLDRHVVEGYGSVKALQVGMSDGKRTRATFTCYESAAGWSTMSPDEQEVRESMERYLDNVLSKPKGSDNTWIASLGRMLARYAPLWLFNVSKDIFVTNMLNRRQEVTCSLSSVSEQMRIHGLTRIDLLKVDVERAELDVLRGVQVEDWPSIRQCVIEVHDMRGRGVQEVCTLMKEVAGFAKIAVQQDADLRGTGLYNVFCRR